MCFSQSGFTALLLATWEGRAQCVQQLLVAGANINATLRTNRQGPLHLAAVQGDAATLQVLLEYSRAPLVIDLPDASGSTPLLISCTHRRLAAMQVLLGAGADPNRGSNDGITCALAWAGAPASKQLFSTELSSTVVSALVRYGAELSAPTSRGLTALVAAVKSGQEALALALLAAGAAWAVHDVGETVGVSGPTLSALASRHGMRLLVDELRKKRASVASDASGPQ
jgi:ankyrin repeat protein